MLTGPPHGENEPGAVVALGKFAADSGILACVGLKVGILSYSKVLAIYTMLYIREWMQLREALWRQHFDIPEKLPKMHRRFDRTDVWTVQMNQVIMDLKRMPPMCEHNVLKIVCRFSATSPYAMYTQGNLYLLYALGLVFSDECSTYWAFARMVKRVHKWGPTTPITAIMIPKWIMRLGPVIPGDTMAACIRFRWLYIMFGQTFKTKGALLAVWDYCMRSDIHALSLCAALLNYGQLITPYSENCCQLQRAATIFNIQISSETVTAGLISQAQLLLQ